MNEVEKICLNTSQMLMSSSEVEQTINAYILPFIIMFGVSGNIINLTVLLMPSLRSRSNKLLAALAFADICFLLMLAPHSLANHNFIGLNSTFRHFYFLIKQMSLALSNWFSAIAIWLTLTICLERLVGIRYPLSSRKGRFCNTHFLILGLVIFTGILTVYHQFEYDCKVKIFCYGTQIHQHCYKSDSKVWFKKQPNPHSALFIHYIEWSPIISAIIVILIPTIFIIISNVLLVKTLNERKAFLRVSTSVKSDFDGRTPSTNHMNSQLKTEQRVALTVCLIVTSFILTQTPSAIFYFYIGIFTPPATELFNTLRIIVTLLVAIGKSINFILFCLSSPSFRQRLISLTKNRFNRSMTKKKGHSRRLSVDTEMTISCSCNENHSLLRNPAETCRCSRAVSLGDTRQKIFSKSRNNTVEFNVQQNGTDF